MPGCRLRGRGRVRRRVQLPLVDPDVVLVDEHMPAVDGYETTERNSCPAPEPAPRAHLEPDDDRTRRLAEAAGFIACGCKDDDRGLSTTLARAARPDPTRRSRELELNPQRSRASMRSRPAGYTARDARTLMGTHLDGAAPPAVPASRRTHCKGLQSAAPEESRGLTSVCLRRLRARAPHRDTARRAQAAAGAERRHRRGGGAVSRVSLPERDERFGDQAGSKRPVVTVGRERRRTASVERLAIGTLTPP